MSVIPVPWETESGEIIASFRLLVLHGKFQATHTHAHRVRPVSNTHAHVGE